MAYYVIQTQDCARAQLRNGEEEDSEACCLAGPALASAESALLVRVLAPGSKMSVWPQRVRMLQLQLSSWLLGVLVLAVGILLPLGLAASRNKVLQQAWEKATGKTV